MKIDFWIHSSRNIAKVNLKKKKIAEALRNYQQIPQQKEFLDQNKESTRAEGSIIPR